MLLSLLETPPLILREEPKETPMFPAGFVQWVLLQENKGTQKTP